MRWNYYKLRQLSLLQSAMDCYYKLRHLFYYKVRHGLLQIATGITEIAMNLLEQIATEAANCDSTSNPIATLLWLFQIARHATK